jgi:hypothetical protein
MKSEMANEGVKVIQAQTRTGNIEGRKIFLRWGCKAIRIGAGETGEAVA